MSAASLRRARSRQLRRRLFDLELDAEVAAIREGLEASRARKRRHDLVNAFTAVEGAAMIMARESLSASDRSTLAEVLDSGLSRLRRLLLSEGDDHVDLAELTSSLAAEPGWPDKVQLDVAADLVVAGSPTEVAEVIRQLMACASWRARSSPVAVRGQGQGERVVLWVEYRGPEPRSERSEAVGPDHWRPAGRDAHHGLHVAARMARGQGGEVVVEPRPGGGGSFGLRLPAYRA